MHLYIEEGGERENMQAHSTPEQWTGMRWLFAFLPRVARHSGLVSAPTFPSYEQAL